MAQQKGLSDLFTLQLTEFNENSEIGSANFSDDDPTILFGQATEIELPTIAFELRDTAAGLISPDRIFGMLENMEVRFVSESFAVDSAGATLPMLIGQQAALTCRQSVKNASLGFNNNYGQIEHYMLGVFSSTPGDTLTQRTNATHEYVMQVQHYKRTSKSGMPQFGTTVNAVTGSDIVDLDIDRRIDTFVVNGVDQMASLRAALGYAA